MAPFKASKKDSETLGLPEGMQFYSVDGIGGMNLEDDRISIEDNELYLLENYIRIGKNSARTLWDVGQAFYTAPYNKTILSFFWFSIGPSNYVMVFHTDGTANQVSWPTGTVTPVSSVSGTFYAPGGVLPACAKWGAQYLLISNNFASNNYWAWDGSVLYQAGTISPSITITGGGLNYAISPTVQAFGGSGSGIIVTPNVVNGSVVNLAVVNPGTGYLPQDVVQFAFTDGGSDTTPILTATLTKGIVDFVAVLAGGTSYATAPTVGFTGGGGTGAAAIATVSGGAVSTVIMTSGGANYTSTPTVTFTGGGGSNAIGAAHLSAGTVSAVNIVNGGTGFLATPSISFAGGGGAGATATVAVSGGAIYSVTITNGGTGYTSAPGVIVAPGTNHSAYATASLMPFVMSGSAIETFVTRAWLVNPFSPLQQQTGGVINTTAPGSISDFATSDGGNSFTANEPFLREEFTNLKQAQGYLYTFADSAVDVISNVQTGGSPLSTTFNYQNVDPQSGTSWRDTVQYFGLSILYANQTGIYGLYGGAVKNVSRKLTTLFDNAILPPSANALTPSSAVANIHTIKCYLLLMTISDPITSATRNVMVGWDEVDWFLVSQSLNINYIGTQAIDSAYTAWGTDGRVLCPLLATPSPTLPKRMSTKLFGGNTFPMVKCSDAMWMVSQDKSSNNAGVTMSVTVDTEYGSTVPDVSPFTFPGPMAAGKTGDNYACYLGLTLTSVSPDFVLKEVVLGYRIVWGGFGSPPVREM